MSCAITFNNGSMKGIHVGKFRKKPVVIEAMQLPSLEDEATEDFLSELHEFLGEIEWESGRDGSLLIPTLEGVMAASPDDWIIKGVMGEFYPCKPEIFAMTYEAVEDDRDSR
jgi:hypothetical protein